ncbi:DUF2141 domain-containing protein [Oculatella sp. LEGE 06141]|uniref:DUF2141 domain-containing protein n=1 Tax=Oculatella sp. LEGE 06141 TaxID=1828648 RepID=UPI0018813C11|nr:DUF2141 domain-containing protein [Oculatella sp. LEGE 06141]MBE9177181.1 DUF2141 domain-containing protein [Oculatella sp. LEGE 06141]
MAHRSADTCWSTPSRFMMLKVSGLVLTSLGSLLIMSSTAQAQLMSRLTVEVMGLRGQEGNFCFKLFNGSRGFPNDNDSAVKRGCVPIADHLPETPDEPFSYAFDDLEFGTYAVAIYHDSNRDEQLNRGAFGMPSEGYGFSNDAPAETGPPNYADAVILVAGSNPTIQIQMRYPQ